MSTAKEVRTILAAYPADLRVSEVEFLAGAGGFSGARFWRLKTGSRLLCLRRWPVDCSAEKLRFIHEVLQHVAREGVSVVPVPIETTSRETIVRGGGHLWELAPWLMGTADYHERPSAARLGAAMRTLAEFHHAAESFPGGSAALRTSPGVISRTDLLTAWQAGDVERLQQAVSSSSVSGLATVARDIIELFQPRAADLYDDLRAAASLRVRLQPCIRDIWDQHVLFEGDRVAGIVDFGAMRIDNVATDIQRLLGSMAGNVRDAWERGIKAYSAARELADDERRLIATLDRSTLLLSGMNWLRWLFLENRQFDDFAAVIARLCTIRNRLAGV
ncbi:MAG: phosphotransferase [Pirellulales bacterium]